MCTWAFVLALCVPEWNLPWTRLSLNETSIRRFILWMKCPIHAWMIFIDFSHGKVLPDQCVQRPNSWTKSFLLGIHSHLYRFALTPPLSVSRGQLLYTVNEKGGKPDKKNHTLTVWFNKSIQKPRVWELSRLCPDTSTKLYVHEFGLWTAKDELSQNLYFRIVLLI